MTGRSREVRPARQAATAHRQGGGGLTGADLAASGSDGRGPVTGLAARQAGLVAALVAGAPLPPGFDTGRVEAARRALLRKRAGEVARAWPALAASLGDRWPAVFAGWGAGRAPQGSLRDGWDLARHLAATAPPLPPAAAEELATREACWRYDARSAPRPRRLPAVRRTPGAVVLQLAGRIRLVRRPR